MAQQRPPEVNIEFSPDYRTIIISGIFGGHRPGFFEAVVYSDELNPVEAFKTIQPDVTKVKIKRTMQIRLYFDPIQAKSILKWLSEHVQQYEKSFGVIPEPGKEGKFDDFR
jgi:hypothetical protein